MTTLRHEEERFRTVFRLAHAAHPTCLQDEWLMRPCALANGRRAPRPLVWSRRNGPWRTVDVLWVGAAPGNAGGRGRGALGAHGTRIPFGGDIAGANLDALLGSIGLTRNETFITAALNVLPAAGGGEPTQAELSRPVGRYGSSVHLLRDTLLAAAPRLIVALGNVALRAIAAAVDAEQGGARLPSLERVRARGAERGVVAVLERVAPFDAAFRAGWRGPEPAVLWLTHPSGQNMSPYARAGTLFHTRMLHARQALRRAVREHLGWTPPAVRPQAPDEGIYALPEWRELVAPRHAVLDRLWREHGI
jgi:uracil-DNA glycosylase family 4